MLASTTSTTPSLPDGPHPTATTKRVLACALCQRRKLKCDRKFPCAHCYRTGSECVPTQAPRQRRRRFPEKDLLDHVRYCESLLHKNNIKFEPLHGPAAIPEQASPSADEDGPNPSPLGNAPSAKKELPFADSTSLWIRNLCNALSQIGFSHDTDDMRDAVIKHAWDITYQSESNDHLLFGSSKSILDLYAFHPEQVHIFKLWQIYLENVNPLLKVTHTPSLQARIIDAIQDLANMDPTLEALVFSIYCVAVLSMTEDQCRASFASSRKDLLVSYQFACQQALLNCQISRTDDRDCLTALYLYLISVRSDTDPRSLSSMLAVAIRTAQRMGLHDESSYTKHTVLEAELRRRLWWSLTIFDNRVCEILEFKPTTLGPSRSCSIPSNVDDSEIRPEMKNRPVIYERPTEAIFAVVRSSMTHSIRNGADLDTIEKTMETKYLAFCDPENSLHFMTIWSVRAYLAKSRLVEYCSSFSSTSQTDAQRDAALSHALRMLECDTKLITSPLTKGFLWHVHLDSPFVGYVHILQDVRERPTGIHVERAWEDMSNNYLARISKLVTDPKQAESMFVVFSRVVLQAWETREALFCQRGEPVEIPPIVSDMRYKLEQMRRDRSQGGTGTIEIDAASFPVPTELGGQAAGNQFFTGLGSAPYPELTAMDIDMSQFWNMRDWNWMQMQGW